MYNMVQEYQNKVITYQDKTYTVMGLFSYQFGCGVRLQDEAGETTFMSPSEFESRVQDESISLKKSFKEMSIQEFNYEIRMSLLKIQNQLLATRSKV